MARSIYSLSNVTKNENLPADLAEAVNQNNVTWDLYDKYKDLVRLNISVHFICQKCGKAVNISWYNLNNRAKYKQSAICTGCIRRSLMLMKLNYPEEIYFKGTKNHPLSWDEYIKYMDIFAKGSSKLYIEGICTECGKKFLSMTGKLLYRTYTRTSQVCPKCLNKYKSNLPEVLRKNSKVQKIAQNRPEVKQKQRIAQAKAMKNDPTLIRKKVIRGNRLCGSINNVNFASSTELEYILLHPEIKNCDITIPYQYKDTIHTYYPDFMYLDVDNKYVLVEIKGAHWHKDKIEAKRVGTLQFIMQHSNQYSRYEFINHNDINIQRLNHGLAHLYSINDLIKLKQKYSTLQLTTIPETMLKQSKFATKQEAIDYINNL